MKTQQTQHINSGNHAGYSLNGINAFASGDAESTRDILTSLVNSTEQNTLMLRQHLKMKDYKQVTELAHKMLPMFRLLEAGAIIELLAELEQKGIDKNFISEILIQAVDALQKIEKLVETIKTEQQLTVGR